MDTVSIIWCAARGITPVHPTRIAVSEKAALSMAICSPELHPNDIRRRNTWLSSLMEENIPDENTLMSCLMQKIIMNTVMMITLDIAVDIPAPSSPSSGMPHLPYIRI